MGRSAGNCQGISQCLQSGHPEDKNSLLQLQVYHVKHESEARASHQVARRSVLIVNELGYKVRL